MKLSKLTVLWIVEGMLTLLLMFGYAMYPDLVYLGGILGAAWVLVLALIVREHRGSYNKRAAAFGAQSVLTALIVIAIVAVINFLAVKNEFKFDLTKNRLFTLSDQTQKLIKGLNKDVQAVVYAKMSEREAYRQLLEDYRSLNPKRFSIEYVDPDKEPTRVKQNLIRKSGTIQLIYGPGEAQKDTKIDEPTEEKLTNSLIKMMKDKAQVICSLVGHGEKSFVSGEAADGLDTLKKALVAQMYEVKDLNLMQEGKVPAECGVIAVFGPTKALFPQEAQLLSAWIDNGGRAMIALDVNVRGGAEYAPEVNQILSSWGVTPVNALVIDPMSRLLGADAAVPIIDSFAQDSAITRDFQGQRCPFAFARPLEISQGNPGITLNGIAKTNPRAWGETDIKSLASGKAGLDGSDKKGPLTVAVTADGKKAGSTAARNTRLLVTGSSSFATNNYIRFGGNQDFVVNGMSWLLEDESMISIRPKEQDGGRLELSQDAGRVILLITLVIMPGIMLVAGIFVWVRRRRL